MAPTSIRIPPELKERVEDLAAKAGKTVHAYVLDALERAAASDARRREFVDAALASRAEFKRSGKGYRAEDVHRYLDERAAGKKPPRPKAVRWRK